jgi:excisionase family DNA binding protein
MAAMGIKAVAKELGISVPSVRRLLKARELGHTRIGRRVVIPAAEVERFQAERFQPAVQAAKGSEG